MTLNKMSILFSVLLICGITIGPCRAQNTAQNYVDAHNTARKAVGVANMTWSGTLATYANNYVKTRLSDCNLIHSDPTGTGPYGENLAKGTGSFSGTAAVKLWTDEKLCYTYSTDSCSTSTSCKFGCKHYTQVVWSESTQIGCARLKCTNGAWFISCNYYPPGNYDGEKPY